MKEYRFRFWAPLTNLESESSKIELADDLFLRKASEEEKEKMGRLIKEWPTITLGDFLLECFISKERPEPWPGEYIEDARIYIEKAITILRLYKDESISYNLIVQPLAEGKTYGITSSTMKHYQLWGKSPKYKIVNKEIDKLKTFFKEFNVDTFEPLSLAIHYFNKSYIEPYTPRDSFLDLMIPLENLYLKGENLELGYKLRMRMAYILTKEIDKRKVIFEDVIDLRQSRRLAVCWPLKGA